MILWIIDLDNIIVESTGSIRFFPREIDLINRSETMGVSHS